MTVVYIDSVFFLNAVTDYLLLLGTARLAGIPLKRRRYILAALGGGVYAAAVFWPGMEFLGGMMPKLAAGCVLALIAYGGEELLFRLTLLFFLVSCALAGGVLALGMLTKSRVPVVQGIFYTDVNGRTLLVTATAAYLLLAFVFRAAACHGIRGELLDAEICLNDQRIRLRALRDTGNSLRNPMSGEPVLVAEGERLAGCFPKEVRRFFCADGLKAPSSLLEPLRQKVPQLCFCLLPYRSVGVSGGMLLAVRSEWVEIAGRRYPGLLIAFSSESVGMGYQALWGGPVERKGYGEHRQTAAASGSPFGIAEDGKYSLHRRKRHIAAAADKRAGGRTSGQA